MEVMFVLLSIAAGNGFDFADITPPTAPVDAAYEASVAANGACITEHPDN